MTSTKNKDGLCYVLFGISADIAQMGRAYIRDENDGVIKNISQRIHSHLVYSHSE